jgi:hypothetical protein
VTASGPVAAAIRTKRPSSASSVTPPLSASSRSGGRDRDLLEEAGCVGAGEEGGCEVPEPLELPSAHRGGVQRALQLGAPLPAHRLAAAERQPRQRGGEQREHHAEPMAPKCEQDADPAHHDREGGQPAGPGRPPHSAASSRSSSRNSVSPVASMRRRYGRQSPQAPPQPVAATSSSSSHPSARASGRRLANGTRRQTHIATRTADTPTGWSGVCRARSRGPGRGAGRRAGWRRRRLRAGGCARGWA